jgi:hypothetical protein
MRKKQAKIKFIWCLNYFFEILVFLVPVLNFKKCLEVLENWFQGYLFTTNIDTKNTENSKKQFKHYKYLILIFAFSIGPYNSKLKASIYPGSFGN